MISFEIYIVIFDEVEFDDFVFFFSPILLSVAHLTRVYAFGTFEQENV